MNLVLVLVLILRAGTTKRQYLLPNVAALTAGKVGNAPLFLTSCCENAAYCVDAVVSSASRR